MIILDWISYFHTWMLYYQKAYFISFRMIYFIPRKKDQVKINSRKLFPKNSLTVLRSIKDKMLRSDLHCSEISWSLVHCISHLRDQIKSLENRNNCKNFKSDEMLVFVEKIVSHCYSVLLILKLLMSFSENVVVNFYPSNSSFSEKNISMESL